MSLEEESPEHLFAADLVRFVMRGHGLPSPPRPSGRALLFVPCVGHVVRHLASLQEERVAAAFDQLRCVVLSGEHFDQLARCMADAHFDNGDEFLLLNFLHLCAQITRLAVLFYSNHVSDAPAKTALALGRALRSRSPRFESCGGWDALYDLCFHVLHRIPRRQRCLAPAKAPHHHPHQPTAARN